MLSSLSRWWSRLPRLLMRGLAAGLIAAGPMAATAAAATDSSAADALWDQPQGIAADSALYFIQSWWDRMTTAAQHDPLRRGMDELQLANGDLLNAYSLLVKERTASGPEAVPVIDPILSRIYAAITGIQAKAPLGALLGSLNQFLLRLEGRSSTQLFVDGLLRDFGAQNQAADRDLAGLSTDDLKTLWAANSERQGMFLSKIRKRAARLTEPGRLVSLLGQLDQERQDLLRKYAPKRSDSSMQPRNAPVPRPPARNRGSDPDDAGED